MKIRSAKLKSILRILLEQDFLTFLKRFLWRIIYRTPFFESIIGKRIRKGTLERRFSYIYKFNYWNNFESASGAGSSKIVTENLRANLPDLIHKFQIKTLCDAPCGDFNWMKDVIENIDVIYTGVDIVPDLIDKLKRFENNHIFFQQGDITSFNFDGFDLILVRDCLFHFSYDDIDSFLYNLSRHNYRYLLTTSYFPDASFENRNIETGDFRRIDLLAAPFNFPSDFIAQISDWVPPESRRYLYLWDKNQVPVKLS